jgi:hypothetical protein
VTEDKAPGCSWAGCSHPPNTSFEGRPFCIAHFLEMAPRRLESIETTLNNQPGARHLSSSIQSVLSQMISEMSALAAGTRQLHPELREKLISLSETAAKLYKRARRPPRFGRSVACRIRISVISTDAPESCSTVDVSQRGASVTTVRPPQVKQLITLEREDTGRRARAKVVWIKQKTATVFMVGLEILDQEDFWGVGPNCGVPGSNTQETSNKSRGTRKPR